MTFSKSIRLAALAALTSLIGCATAPAVDVLPPTAVKNVILVHGAWADGESWDKVIPILEARGFHVVAVQEPLTSLADDAATVKRAIALADGQVILVGHSYGGAVITEAGNDPKVAGLVYVAAFAPDAGQSAGEQAGGYPPTPGGAEIRPDAGGFLKLTDKGIDEDFCPDLSAADRRLVAVAQGPLSVKAIGGKVTTAAWKSKPNWYVVAGNDRMIAPAQERASAAAMHAQTIEIAGSSHVAMLSHPAEVEAIIEKAASGSAGK